jgi:hypothetical protein
MCHKNEKRKLIRRKVEIAGLVVICVFLCLSPAVAESTSSYEYRLKATFIYQFVNFIDGWKFEQEKDEEKAIVLGIIGKDPFEDAFQPLADKTAKERKIEVKRFEGFSNYKSRDKDAADHPQIDQLKKCDILFVCSSEQKYIDKILGLISNERILTIADTMGFLEKGGIINFIIEKDKIRFEINVEGARRAKLTIRSKLLRLAIKVIKKDEVEDA